MNQFEVTVEECKAMVELGEKLAKLESYPEFQELILKGFFEEEAIRCAPLMASPNEAARKGAMDAMIGIGALQAYLRSVYMNSLSAKQGLAELESGELVDEE